MIRLFLILALALNLNAVTLTPLSTPHPDLPKTAASSFSDNGQVSRDGRRVLFESQAGDLCSPPPARGLLGYYINVYVRDLATKKTELVSVNRTGNLGGLGNSFGAAMSEDGRFVVFQSEAADLVEGDTNQVMDVFIRDLQQGTTSLVSRNANGSSSGNAASQAPVITPDGRFIAFTSLASDLATGDTNGIQDVFLRNTQTGDTILISRGARETDPPSLALSEAPSISEDGQTVAFVSTAAFPELGLINSLPRIFIRDLATDTLRLVGQAVLANAAPGRFPVEPVTPSYSPDLSSDGRWLAFRARASGPPTLSPWFGLLFDVPAQSAAVISSNTFGIEPAQPDQMGPFISGDSNKVLVQDLVRNVNQVYLWDIATGEKILISANLAGEPANAHCEEGAVSDDGKFVVFVSRATDLVPGVTNGTFQVFMRDVENRATRLVSAAAEGHPGGSVENTIPGISGDGQIVVYEALDGTSGSGDDNRAMDVFVRDMRKSAAELISGRDPLLRPSTARGFSTAPIDGLNAAGTKVLIVSSADDITPNDTNGVQDIFQVHLQPHRIQLISGTESGVPGNGQNHDPLITPDGSVVVFASLAKDLTALPDTNAASDLFWHDTGIGTNGLISRSFDGMTTAQWTASSSATRFPTGSASVSDNGQVIAYLSGAANLFPPDSPPSSSQNLLVFDRTAGTSTRVDFGDVLLPSISPSGEQLLYWKSDPSGIKLRLWEKATQNSKILQEWSRNNARQVFPIAADDAWQTVIFEGPIGMPVTRTVQWLLPAVGELRSATALSDGTEPLNSTSPRPAISGNGRFVVFLSDYSGYAPSDTNGTRDVFRRDLETGSLLLISVNTQGTASGNGPSGSPVVSADGRFVAFESDADDLVPGDQNGASDVFVRDVDQGKTTLVSANQAGFSGDARSFRPLINSTGDVVVFSSLASDLVERDFNDAIDVFLANLGVPRLSRVGLESGQLAITFATISGRKYRVEAVDDLRSSTWIALQEVSGTGAEITTRHPLGAAGTQRFYRVAEVP